MAVACAAGQSSTGGTDHALEYDFVEIWTIIASRIAVAGGAYGVLCAVVGMGLQWLGYAMGVLTGSQAITRDILWTPLIVLIAAAVWGAIGVVWAAVVSLIVLPLYYLFVRSLRLRASLVWIGAGCGGFVGFVATTPILLSFVGGNYLYPGIWHPFWLPLVGGPLTTTILGQIGGAIGGLRASQLSAVEKAKILAAAGQREPKPDDGTPAPGCPDTTATRGPLLQFRIRHLMGITFWLCLLLGAIRFSGLPFQLILPLMAVWLVFQAATLAIGGWLAPRMWPRWQAWRARRARRST